MNARENATLLDIKAARLQLQIWLRRQSVGTYSNVQRCNQWLHLHPQEIIIWSVPPQRLEQAYSTEMQASDALTFWWECKLTYAATLTSMAFPGFDSALKAMPFTPYGSFTKPNFSYKATTLGSAYRHIVWMSACTRKPVSRSIIALPRPPLCQAGCTYNEVKPME